MREKQREAREASVCPKRWTTEATLHGQSFEATLEKDCWPSHLIATDTFVPVGNTDRLVQYISPHTAYLGKSSDSVLIGEEWRVIPNLKVKVNCLVCEGGELVAETELEGAVLGCCEGKAVILLLHLLVESGSIWVLQTTVHIIMATGHNL